MEVKNQRINRNVCMTFVHRRKNCFRVTLDQGSDATIRLVRHLGLTLDRRQT